jgi:hypothetical protein
MQAQGNLRDRIVEELRSHGLRTPTKISKRMMCLHCFETRVANCTSAQVHLALHCSACPSDLRSIFCSAAQRLKVSRVSEAKLQTLSSQVSLETTQSQAITSGSSASFTQTSPTFVPKRQQTLREFSDRRLSTRQVHEIDTKLVRWAFGRGLPFSVISDGSLRDEVLGKLNASYSAQSTITPWTIRYRFLDDEFHMVEQDVIKALRNASTVCLVTDGWSGLQRRHILNVLLTTPTPILARCIYTGEDAVTAEYQAKALGDIIEEHAKHTKVIAVCTDNASVNRKTWRLLKARFPSLLTYGCACHALQLLANDIFQHLCLDLKLSQQLWFQCMLEYLIFGFVECHYLIYRFNCSILVR